MKSKLIVFICAVMTAVVMCSCGSNWTISGNNMTVVKVDNDTIAPAGSYIMLPDSFVNSID